MSRHSQLKSTKPLSRRGGRRLRCELLESRMLLAGDTYLINFQFDEAPTPTRYLRDVEPSSATAATASAMAGRATTPTFRATATSTSTNDLIR